MLCYRTMKEQDLNCVTAIEAAAGPHPWESRNFTGCFKTNYACLIAEQDNQPVGHGILLTAAGEAHLLIITVARDCQGKGFGKEILRHLISLAQEKAETLFLEVRASNKAAFNLYLQEGFSEIGRRRNYYPGTQNTKAEDAIVMALDLTYF